MTNDKPVYILPLVKINVYWPNIGNLYCMTPICRYYNLLPPINKNKYYTEKKGEMLQAKLNIKGI